MTKKKKKNRNLCPRTKRMKQAGRLASAKAWIPTYTGKSILKAYRTRYGVDYMCAIRELELLGVPLDPEYVANLKRCLEGELRAKIRKKAEAQASVMSGLFESDENFSFIAGYTEGGAPYGTPWEV